MFSGSDSTTSLLVHIWLLLLFTLATWFLKAFKFATRLPWDFPSGSVGKKKSTCNAGYVGSIPGSRRSPGKGNGDPFQYSCLGNPIDRGAWWTTVHGAARVGHDLAATPPPPTRLEECFFLVSFTWMQMPPLPWRCRCGDTDCSPAEHPFSHLYPFSHSTLWLLHMVPTSAVCSPLWEMILLPSKGLPWNKIETPFHSLQILTWSGSLLIR